MTLTQMTPGGRWVQPPHDAPPVYVPPKQLEAHFKRLIADGWMPTDDPRREEDQREAKPVAQIPATEIAMQSRIDQLEAMVMQLLTQKSEQPHGSTHDVSSTNSESQNADQRSSRRKPAV